MNMVKFEFNNLLMILIINEHGPFALNKKKKFHFTHSLFVPNLPPYIFFHLTNKSLTTNLLVIII